MLYEVLSKLNILRLKYSSTSNCIRKSEEFFFPYYVLCTRCTGLRGFRHSIAVFFFFEMIEKIENTTYRSKTFSTLFLISKCRRAERKVNSACGCSKKKKRPTTSSVSPRIQKLQIYIYTSFFVLFDFLASNESRRNVNCSGSFETRVFVQLSLPHNRVAFFYMYYIFT